MKASFWNPLAKIFDKHEVLNPEVLKLVKKHLRSEDYVLEMGAGTGALALNLTSDCQTIEVCDFSPEMVAEAQKKEGPANVTFSLQDGADLTYKADSFDLVLGMNLLHIVADLDGVLSEVQRVLKPDGLLIVQVVTFKEQQFVSIITRWAMEMLKFRLWPVETYERILSQHGLVVEASQEVQRGSQSIIIIARRQC